MLRRGLLYIMWICCIVFSRPSQCQKLTLDGAIGEALIKNPELLKACQELKAVNADVWEGISPEYPELFVEWEGIPEGVRSLSGFEEKKTGISQEFDFPLAYAFKGQQFHQQQKQVAAEYLQTRNEITADVKKRFYRVLLLGHQIQLYETILQITKENFQKARIRVLAGESSPYDTLKVKVDLTEAENQHLSIQEEYGIAKSELNQIMGRNIEIPLDLDGELQFSPVTFDLQSLQEKALSLHPHLKFAKARISEKKAERSLAWTGMLPNLSIRYFKQEFNGISPTKGWGGELGLSVPVWFFLKGQGQIRSASHRVQAAVFQAESKKKSVLLEINKIMSQLLVAEKKVRNYKVSTLLEVEELVRIATRSYQEGEMGYLEVAEALRTMNRVKAGYYEALFQYLAARADLELAVGVSLGQ